MSLLSPYVIGLVFLLGHLLFGFIVHFVIDASFVGWSLGRCPGQTHQSGAIWGFIHYLGRQKGNVVLMLEEHWALSVGQFSFNVYFIGYIFCRAKYFGAAEALAFKVKKKMLILKLC